MATAEVAPARSALGSVLERAAAAAPAAPHLQVFAPDGSVAVTTFAESAAAARAMAAALIAAGVKPGEVVAVIGDPSPLQVQASFAVWLAGGVLCPLDPQWDSPAHGRALAKAKVRVGLALPGRVDQLGAAARDVAGFRVLAAEPASRASEGPAARLPQVEAESRALVLFTSGTTGEPKAAVLRHRALAWNAAAVLKTYDLTPADNVLAVLPLHHVFGLLTTVILPAMIGARATFPPSLRGPDVAQTMRGTGVTLVAAVPQLVLGFDRAIQARIARSPWILRRLIGVLMALTRAGRKLGFNPGRVLFRSVHRNVGPDLRILGSGGAALDPVAANRLFSLGFGILEAYGLTETGPAVSFDRVDRPTFGSVGYPIPGLEVRIDQPDETGSGEVVVRSPSLFDGYLDDPEETAKVLRDGWFYTGDLGRLDREGRLWITGRRKEVIVLGSGKNVYPHEVEARLDDSTYIKESCVVGLTEPGQTGSEKLHAVIVPDLAAFREVGSSRVGVTLHEEVIRIGDQLPSHHRVTGITLRSEPLPRTPLGKLRRFEVLRDLKALREGSRTAGAATAPPPASPHWPAVAAALRRAAGKDVAISGESNIELDLGLDSLARVEALAALEEELGTKLPEGFGAEVLTAGELLEMVEAHLDRGEAAAGFGAIAASGDGELDVWQRRLLRPVGVVVVTVVTPLLIVLAELLWGFRVRGRENLPHGAFLVCPNHGSYLDAAVAAMALPFRYRLRFWSLGDYKLFGRPLFRILAWGGRVIRLDAGAGLKATLEAGGAVLRSGAPLVLFPEGVRAHAGERAVFRRGAAILARALQVPIVPTWFEGVDELLPRGRWLPRLGPRVTVRFGAPLQAAAADGAADPAAALTEMLRERVLALGEEEKRDRQSGGTRSSSE